MGGIPCAEQYILLLICFTCSSLYLQFNTPDLTPLSSLSLLITTGLFSLSVSLLLFFIYIHLCYFLDLGYLFQRCICICNNFFLRFFQSTLVGQRQKEKELSIMLGVIEVIKPQGYLSVLWQRNPFLLFLGEEVEKGMQILFFYSDINPIRILYRFSTL